jgi:two-component system response regulator AtoC
VLLREASLWQSDSMQRIWRIIQQAAGIDVTVLISGETGTGKDLVARAIHHLSFRRRAPYVPVNCAAVPRDLLESELFGHERGAFTGAHQLQTGKFESADRGTIFLDEIADLHPALQAKLLHVLQDGSFSRVGGKAPMKVDVRVLAATNRDLALAVSTERFRDDLYYRLNVIHITVPPLRERREEIPLLAAYFVERYSKLFHRVGFELTQGAVDRLMRHPFPGNVRELENVIKRMIVLGDADLTKTSLPSQSSSGHGSSVATILSPASVHLKDVARKAALRAEREEILKMLAQTRWNRVRAAKLLNISYRSLLYKMKASGLDRMSGIRFDLQDG